MSGPVLTSRRPPHKRSIEAAIQLISAMDFHVPFEILISPMTAQRWRMEIRDNWPISSAPEVRPTAPIRIFGVPVREVNLLPNPCVRAAISHPSTWLPRLTITIKPSTVRAFYADERAVRPHPCAQVEREAREAGYVRQGLWRKDRDNPGWQADFRDRRWDTDVIEIDF